MIYVLKYEKYYPPATREYTEDLCEKLVRLQDLLSARGKEMYIFITPTKVRYYEEFVPDIYRQNNRFPDEPGNYEQFTDTLKNYPLHVYDSIPWINERATTADFPLFYRTGTHWSWVLGMEVAADFARYLTVIGGGRIYVDSAVDSPEGMYYVSLLVENEGHSALLENVFTFIIE